MLVVIVVSPDILSYTALFTVRFGASSAISNVSAFTAEAAFIVPVKLRGLVPSATNPKLPNDELEFVTSHCPPVPQKIPTSLLIVNIETICAYPLFVMEQPMPF